MKTGPWRSSQDYSYEDAARDLMTALYLARNNGMHAAVVGELTLEYFVKVLNGEEKLPDDILAKITRC